MRYLRNSLVTIVLVFFLFGYLAYGGILFPYGSISAKVSALIIPILFGLSALFLIKGKLVVRLVILNVAPVVSGAMLYLFATASSWNPESNIQFVFIVLYLLAVMVASSVILSIGFASRNRSRC